MRGGPLDELAGRPPLTAEQESALGWRIRGVDVPVPAPGDARPSPLAARNRLVEQNVRLVMAISRQYRRRGVDRDDLVQEGLLSLHRAAEKFDPARGFRFGTYATWWVRHAMSRVSIEGAAAARGPAGLVGQPDPTLQELDETLPDPGPTPEQEVLERSERAELRGLIEALPWREREIVRSRLGLDGRPPAGGRPSSATRRRAYELAVRALLRLHYRAMVRSAATSTAERPSA